MTIIRNWTAARSGPAVTVKGETLGGGAVRVADVRQLAPSHEKPGHVLAVTKSGARYFLAV